MDPFDSYKIDKKSDIPIWVQLKQRLIYLIMSGSYKPGDQLPTVRELAVQLDINYHTVNKVYHELEGSGLIEVQAGRGSHVADPGNSKFVTYEGEPHMITAEYVAKLLQLGMTAEEVVRMVANHLDIDIAINSPSESKPVKERSHRVG
ncbi:GntR family transcriptional regulator [Eggerthella sp. YY7918]|uniref:GntR family transcriptional regulator n=1 Tax=Eggerthella sp. (strain YY7918) TaxID=502558 RepID=UPI00021712DF|nr:GntR family transcriptional regulator [Eggerthella sp. YY7918]BAK44774.1 predicted transcriptional regulator [Eggerthella sp. YY7918]